MKHYLRDGQSYEALSAKYKVPVCMIVRANDLAKAGKKDLDIPRKCYCNRCGGRAWSRYEMYEVSGNDTIDSIANAFGISVTELAEINGIDAQVGVRAGDVISVPIG